MPEKFIISPEAAKIFTPDELRRIKQGARDNELAEAKRSGDYVEYADPGPEEFGSINNGIDRINLRHNNKIISRPQSRSTKKAGAGNYGWLNAWQEKNEIDRGKRKNKKKI